MIIESAVGGRGGIICGRIENGALGETSLKRKPPGYWMDFANLERELRAFMIQSGLTTMPTTPELVKAHRADLLNAIHKNGGFVVVAVRIGLIAPPKPVGYWGDFANLDRELRGFMKQSGLSTMPIRSELRKAHRADLLNAIYEHGGMSAVAARMGLTAHSKPVGYWSDFANLDREIWDFMNQTGLQTMPTSAELANAHRGDLVHAIYQNGGWSAVAAKMGLPSRSNGKPAGYWMDFANLERELRTFMNQSGLTTMPTTPELANAHRHDLLHAIHQHCGFAAVAAKMGVLLHLKRKPDGYWTDFANLEREIWDFISQFGLQIMPTDAELRKVHRHDLLNAIQKWDPLESTCRHASLSIL